MRILYHNSYGERRLQEINLEEVKSCVAENRGESKTTYAILNRVAEFDIHENRLATRWLVSILKENGFAGKKIEDFFTPKEMQHEMERYTSIRFGDDIFLNSKERKAFWAAIKEAIKRHEKIFDIDEWYKKYTKENKK